jgi:hypothetical protein
VATPDRTDRGVRQSSLSFAVRIIPSIPNSPVGPDPLILRWDLDGEAGRLAAARGGAPLPVRKLVARRRHRRVRDVVVQELACNAIRNAIRNAMAIRKFPC